MYNVYIGSSFSSRLKSVSDSAQSSSLTSPDKRPPHAPSHLLNKPTNVGKSELTHLSGKTESTVIPLSAVVGRSERKDPRRLSMCSTSTESILMEADLMLSISANSGGAGPQTNSHFKMGQNENCVLILLTICKS